MRQAYTVPPEIDMWWRVVTLFYVAFRDFVRGNCHYVAAGIAFWTAFSLFPLALAAISLLSFIYTSPEEQTPLVEAIVRLVPVSEDYLTNLIQDIADARGTLGILAILGLLWPGTAMFSAVRKGINHAWGIGRPQNFLLERAIDLAMLAGMAFLAFIMVLSTTNTLGVASLASAPGWLEGNLGGRVLLEIVALAFTIGAFMLLYRYVPNTGVAWRDAWLGAVIGGALFQGVRLGFAWYAASFSNFNLVYGSLGALMAILVWAYLSSIAIMWGAQVAFTYSRVFGTHANSLPELQPRATDAQHNHRIQGALATVSRWLQPSKRSQP